jgi:DNA-binding CsgD family transcriptional regulator
MKAAGQTNVEIAMIANRDHATIWAHVRDERDETAERIIRLVSR